MNATRAVKLWAGAHKWSSLLSTLFLLVLCLTGLPLVFSDEIRDWSTPAPLGAASDRAAPRQTLDALVRAEREPGVKRFVQFVFWTEGDAEHVGLGVGKVADAPLDDISRLLVDARTGQVSSETPPESGLMPTLLEIHRNLCAGSFGTVLLGVVALAFVVSTVSGIVIYGPYMGRLSFGTVRGHARKLKWLDLHNLVGIATAVWALVVGATGLVNTLETPLFGAWQADQLPQLLATHENDAPLSNPSSLDAAVATARAALPGMQPASIALPGTRYATPRHYLIWMHGTRTLTKRLFTPVLVDAATGELAQAAPLPWYLRVLEVSRPLHFGDYGGMPLKLLWAAFDLLLIGLLGSGLYLWAVKWRAFAKVSGRSAAAIKGTSHAIQ